MRCHDARKWLDARYDGDSDLAPSDAQALDQHLQQCTTCRAFEQKLQRMHAIFSSSAPRRQVGITTDRIMLAIQQQQRITQQLQDIRQQQQSRVERIRSIGAAFAALSIFTISSIPLLLLAMTIVQTDLVVKGLYWLNGVIDICIILAQYLQIGLATATHNSWLLSGIAFIVVIMMGMWLRLMRPPQEA
ncbi:MAG: zf-HC2 domain-containing protein [Ktedonobacteraceae bacterium]|nr:zf-HC2 domain-containing protein [Ktedonobacteraceae bacterium]